MIRRPLMTYGQAVQILVQNDSAFINLLDQALGLGLLAAALVTPTAVLPYFEAKNELIARLTNLSGNLRQRVTSASRLEYEELLTAAHAIIVVAAYSEVLAEQMHKLDRGGKWRKEIREWKPSISSKSAPERRERERFVEWASHATVLPPSPTRPFEQVLAELNQIYQTLGSQALKYLTGFARWDDLTGTERNEITHALRVGIVDKAIARFRELFARLAAQVPEYMIWTLLSDSSATRHTIRSLASARASENQHAVEEFRSILGRLEAIVRSQRAALDDLPMLLSAMTERQWDYSGALQERIIECHQIHKLILDKPLLTPRLAPGLEMISFPPIDVGYINPDYRIAETAVSDQGRLIAQDAWWSNKSVKMGLGGFLAAYFRTAKASQQPLLILGDPGSGKSLLSKVLAAQLPPDEFSVARVELRHVKSSQEISDQIDRELLRQTNNRYRLQDLTDRQGRITRVVIMDGLDELLQLSPHQNLGRYLEWLNDFQAMESKLGHPVIAIATARTIVMDRIFVPSRTAVIRLEPFSEKQITAWLDVWNRENSDYFYSRKLEALDVRTALAQAELARQPLLLALLALYDAEENSLRDAANLSQPELYERLFRRYLEREVERGSSPVRENDRNRIISDRLRELSVIALGMLNRRRQFITRQEVEEDFRAFNLTRESEGSVMASKAEDAIGQFFFLYRAEAVQGNDERTEGYEFIHSTFGEFLAARLIAHQVARAIDVARRAPGWDSAQAAAHARSVLAPFLSRRPLVSEEQVLVYLGDIAKTLPQVGPRSGQAVASHVQALMDGGPVDGGGWSSAAGSYTNFLSTLTLNLIVVGLRISESIRLGTLSATKSDELTAWRRLISLWKANLALDDWDRVLESFALSGDKNHRLTRQFSGGLNEEFSCGDIRAAAIRRLALEGRLRREPELSAAATVWNFVRGAMFVPRDMVVNDVQNLTELVVAAFFRIGYQGDGDDVAKSALARLIADGASAEHLLDLVIGGVSIWTDGTLEAVGDQLIRLGKPILDVSGLLRLVKVLDGRKMFTVSRRLMRLLPSAGETRGLTAIDMADIVALCRRHELPDTLGRCVRAQWFSSEAVCLMSLEDVAWMLECRAYSNAEVRALRRGLNRDLKYMRALSVVRGSIDQSPS